ncbi:MAG: sulfatase [Planctomycetes bacterium]|nr:sulfatase [Planctomycetota bacterium]
MRHQNPYDGDKNEAGNDKKPNVIWFMVDQMRAQAMSIAGDPNVHTPNLDRMARDGTWFENAVSGFPLCCPARGSFISGQYPHHCVPGHEFGMDEKIETIADPFNAAGYHTAYFGKWHLNGWHEGYGRGGWHIIDKERRARFDTWVGYENNNSQFDCWVHGHEQENEIDLYKLPGHETDALTDMLLKNIEKHKDENFFQVCSVQPPHDPYSAPAEWCGRHSPADIKLRANVPPIERIQKQSQETLAGYYSLIEQIDHSVGRVMDKLYELGIDDHTYIMFFSDHGDQHGSHGHTHKMTPLEESIRVPMLIWGGRRFNYRAQTRVPHVINHVDVPSTTLGLCNIKAGKSMQGYDYSPLIRQAPCDDAPTEAYLQCVVPTQHGPSIDLPWRGIVTEDGWKYVAIEGQPLYMYDLSEDPYELHNMAHHAEYKNKRHELNTLLQTWIDKTDDTFTLPEFNDIGQPVLANTVTEEFKKTGNSYTR